MRVWEIIDEDDATGTVKPVTPSSKPSKDRFQTAPSRRTRRQDGLTGRWQEPPPPVKSVAPIKPVPPAGPAA